MVVMGEGIPCSNIWHGIKAHVNTKHYMQFSINHSKRMSNLFPLVVDWQKSYFWKVVETMLCSFAKHVSVRGLLVRTFITTSASFLGHFPIIGQSALRGDLSIRWEKLMQNMLSGQCAIALCCFVLVHKSVCIGNVYFVLFLCFAECNCSFGIRNNF